MARGKTTAKAARRKARKLKGRIAAKKKKEFLYRGKNLQELQEMSLEEFTRLLPTRARRSLNRGLLEKSRTFFKHLEKDGRTIKTHSRDMIILPNMVNKTLAIHDGKVFSEVTVTSEMLGHFAGEFAPTRKQVKHTGVGVGATRSSKYMPLK
ncbi:MAG: 30S ribosomal protein S19 [Candidatus Thermoplasmatota archaeon]|nr:30S ribosomal protein S19 [Candidatus Thermoplasmatota archaeon]